MVLDTLGLSPYVCPSEVGAKKCPEQYPELRRIKVSTFGTGNDANVHTRADRVWAGLRGLGLHIPRDTRGIESFSSASARWHSSFAHRLNPLSGITMEDRCPADCRALADFPSSPVFSFCLSETVGYAWRNKLFLRRYRHCWWLLFRCGWFWWTGCGREARGPCHGLRRDCCLGLAGWRC